MKSHVPKIYSEKKGYGGFYINIVIYRAQLFKTNDVVSQRIVKVLIIKYDIYANIFAEKKNVSSFCIR